MDIFMHKNSYLLLHIHISFRILLVLYSLWPYQTATISFYEVFWSFRRDRISPPPPSPIRNWENVWFNFEDCLEISACKGFLHCPQTSLIVVESNYSPAFMTDI